jgi:hypothetical protein
MNPHGPRFKLTYANVTSTLCLLLLLGGGTAYAASRMLPKNSVGSRQIKKGAVTPAKLSKAAKAALRGPQGVQGNPGAPGTTASAGLPPSASASVAEALALTGTLAPIVHAQITTTQQSRIEETTIGVFETTAPGTITCEARIEPQAGGAPAPMGNSISVHAGAGGAAEGNAGGAIVEPPGSYTVSVDCSTTGTTTVSSADMNVISGAP